MVESVIQNSMIRKAVDKGILDIHIVNPRDFTEGTYRQIDDAPYGGGGGMILMAEPLFAALDQIIDNLKDGNNTKII